VGAKPTEGPIEEGNRPDEEPACCAGTGRQPVRVQVPPLPLQEVNRPDEEPVPKTGRGASPCGCESHRFRHAAMVQVAKTPGPQPGGRGSTPRRGTNRRANQSERQRAEVRPAGPVPGGREARRPAVTRKAGVRCPPWQRIARWPRIQARGCRPRHGGESPSRASMSDPMRRNGDPSPAPPRGSEDPAASRRGNSRHLPRPTQVHGSQSTWSSFNGEDLRTPP
jgi:hypothetical protein